MTYDKSILCSLALLRTAGGAKTLFLFIADNESFGTTTFSGLDLRLVIEESGVEGLNNEGSSSISFNL